MTTQTTTKKAPAKKPAAKRPAKKSTIRSRKAAAAKVGAADLAKPAGDAYPTPPIAAAAIAAGAPAWPEPARPPGQVRQVPFAQLTPCPLNPRRSIGDVAELAESIAQHGVLQNLLARPKAEGDLEIVIGERRWTAFAKLVEDGRRTKEDALPVRVEEIGDGEVIAIGLVENKEREDLNPMDEAEAFARLVGMGWSTEQLAERLPFGRRFVQKRLTLTEKLAKPAKAALRAGTISTEQALTLAAFCHKDRQKDAVENIAEGRFNYRRTEDLKATLLHATRRADLAVFDLADYTAAGGAVIEDDGVQYLEDVPLFDRLQAETRDRRKTVLEGEGWAWVKTVDGYDPPNFYRYKKTKTKKLGGCFLVINGGGRYEEHVGYYEPGDKKAAKPAAGKSGKDAIDYLLDGEPLTKAAKSEARRIKTRAMRAAMMAADDPVFAMAATIVALAGGGGSSAIRFRRDYGNQGYRVEAPDVDAAIERHGKGLGRPGGYDGAIRNWRALMEMDREDLTKLFVAMVADTIGTYPGHDEDLGDDELALAMANDMKAADHVDATLDEAFLKSCREPFLVALAHSLKVTHPTKDPEGCETLPVEKLVKMPAGQLRKACLRDEAAIHGHRFKGDYPVPMPALLWFATKESIEKQWAVTVGKLREQLAKAKGAG